MRDAQNCAVSTPFCLGMEFSLFVFFLPFAKNKCAKLAIGETGFSNPQKGEEK
jgi:hypothetical protein